MRLTDIIRYISNLFEKKRSNPIQLDNDSNLESNLKFLKVSDKSTPIQISEDEVNIQGTLNVNGSAVQTGTEVGATQLNELSDVTYSSGDLTIDSLDTIIVGALLIDSSNDITLDAAGNQIWIANAGTTFGQFDTTAAQKLKIIGTTDYNVELHTQGGGDIYLQSSDNIRIDAVDSVIFDSDGTYIMNKDGTEFSAANSAYAGMILGYTDIGLDEADATYNLTTSYAVPTSEFSVTFVAPPSGKVEIYIQVQFNAGSAGQGDLYAGLSDNATYNAVEDFHEVELIDQSGRFGLETVVHSWTLEGLTAGTSYERWVGFKSTSTSGTPTINYGSNATGEYPDFIMKATALPETITT